MIRALITGSLYGEPQARTSQAGKLYATATNLMQAVKSLGMADSTAELFGFDDSAMRQAKTMAQIATRNQRRLSEQLSAVQGAAKRPEQARALGVDVADPDAVRAKIAEIKQERDAWETWSTNPDLVSRIRAEAEAQAGPRASAATGTAAHPAETARALVAHPDVRRLGDRIRVVERQADLRPELRPQDGGPVKAVIDRGKIVLVGEHWTADDLARMEGVLQHEGGVHLARDSGFYDPSVQAAGKVLRAVGLKALAGEASWNDVTRQFQALVRNHNSTAQRAHELARNALGEAADAQTDRLAEEALGYLAELNPRHSLIRRLMATVKAVLYRMGVKIELGDAELVALARLGLKQQARQQTGANRGEMSDEARYSQSATPRTKFDRSTLTTVTGKEFADFSREPLDLKALRQAAKEYAQRANIQRTVTNQDTGASITIQPRGIRETLQHGSGPQKIQSIAALDRLLENGVEVYTGADLKGRPFKVRVFAAKLDMGGQRYLVALGTKERSDRTLFYDHEMLEVARLGAATPQSSESLVAEADAPRQDSSLISIALKALQNNGSVRYSRPHAWAALPLT